MGTCFHLHKNNACTLLLVYGEEGVATVYTRQHSVLLQDKFTAKCGGDKDLNRCHQIWYPNPSREIVTAVPLLSIVIIN